MKTLLISIVLLMVVILRLNMPENDAGKALAAQQKGGMVNELAGQLLFSDAMADWRYTDLLLVKFACSERLKLKLIGLPFNQWREYERNIQSCELKL